LTFVHCAGGVVVQMAFGNVVGTFVPLADLEKLIFDIHPLLVRKDCCCWWMSRIFEHVSL
jgi:hypothetical protein